MSPRSRFLTDMKLSYEKYTCTLLVLFAVWWTVLAVNPSYRHDWLLENVLLVPAFALLIWGWKRRLFSRVSHTLIFVFLCLHEIGAHYTYEKVPYDDWWRALTGGSFNEMMGWERNHFDRLLHFLYGLLCAYPFREIFLRVARVRGFWAYFLPLDVMLSTSALFELMGGGDDLWWGVGGGVSGHAGGCVGCAQRHGAGGLGSSHRRAHHRPHQWPLPARLCP